ncbi:UPF0147 family protein [Candidatus Woesearchaeota archaeon]|nr:UPF0147 family protein [Candidatus Woesearchaeota archaeon]
MMTKIVSEQITSMLGVLEELQSDNAIPRNVKDKLTFCSSALQEECEISIRVDKVRHALEEISDDTNLEPYARTQLWSIASILEKL